MKYTTLSVAILLPTAALAASVSKRDPSPASNLPTGWAYSGCFVDSVSARSLGSAEYYDNSGMTAKSCIAFCSSKGFAVAGTEYSRECYCGVALPNQAAADGCNMACSGDSTQVCGGPNRLSVYSSTSSSPPGTNPGPPGWTSVGCYSDQVRYRTLSARPNTPGGSDALTVAVCTAACQAQSFVLAGLEYAGECYCDNVVENGGAPASDGCSMPCKSNSSEFCSGSNRLNLYKLSTATLTSVPPATPAYPSNPTCAATYMSSGQISNGEWESDTSGWTLGGNNAVGKALDWHDVGPYEGCNAFVISPSAPGAFYTLTSSPGVTPGSTHTLTLYLGRRFSSPLSILPVGVYAAINAPVGGRSWSTGFAACSGAGCSLQGANGSVWQEYVGANINVQAYQMLPLTLSVSWGTGTPRTDGGDDLLIDGISVA